MKESSGFDAAPLKQPGVGAPRLPAAAARR